MERSDDGVPDEMDLSNPDVFASAVGELIMKLKEHSAVSLTADLFRALSDGAKVNGGELGRFLSVSLGKPVLISDTKSAIYMCELQDVAHLLDNSS